MIKRIEIICKPCHKCEVLQERISRLIATIQEREHIKIKCDVKYNTNIVDANLYGYNVTQLPILLINGSVEFVGHVKEVHLIRMKFEEIMREG